ncbi:MAG: peptidoglycan DD-metalloendopeptidase family protein [Lysobacteraceae bacterium]
MPSRSITPRSTSSRCLAALAAFAMLAACGHSTVVRTPPRHESRIVRPAAPKPGATAVVRPGETVYRIATRHGISPLDLAMWNRILPPYTIHPGQRLRLTPPPDRASPPVASTSPRPTPSAPTAPSGGRPPSPPASTSPASTTPTTPKPPAPPPVAASASFPWRWPADGALVGTFAAGDPTRQGIDIGGRAGAPVRAAADGMVVYSGAGLVGYGELIIIKHDDQWLSAYGHNRARLVNEGQRVKAGEQIAEMGHSGAARDMLHFEIRFNGKPQDPLQALPKR